MVYKTRKTHINFLWPTVNYTAVQIIIKLIEEIASIVNQEGQYKIEKADRGV